MRKAAPISIPRSFASKLVLTALAGALSACGQFDSFMSTAGHYSLEKSVSFNVKASGVTSSAVDLVIVVDTSGSMNEETALVIANLQRFYTSLATFADTQVTLVMDQTTATANNLTFASSKIKLLPQGIDSNNGPAIMLDLLDPSSSLGRTQNGTTLRASLRATAQPVFLFVTDDNAWEDCSIFNQLLGSCRFKFSRAQADEYSAALLNSMKTFLGRAPVFDGIIGHRNVPVSNLPSCQTSAATGYFYIEAAKKSGGNVWSICLQNWSELFDEIANNLRVTFANGYDLPSDFASIISIVVDGRVIGDAEYTVTGRRLILSSTVMASLEVGAKIEVNYMTP